MWGAEERISARKGIETSVNIYIYREREGGGVHKVFFCFISPIPFKQGLGE